jgi:hypothetical protein
MKYRTRNYYTDSQKAVMWERWKEGWTLHQIGQLFDRPHTSIPQWGPRELSSCAG